MRVCVSSSDPSSMTTISCAGSVWPNTLSTAWVTRWAELKVGIMTLRDCSVMRIQLGRFAIYGGESDIDGETCQDNKTDQCNPPHHSFAELHCRKHSARLNNCEIRTDKRQQHVRHFTIGAS